MRTATDTSADLNLLGRHLDEIQRWLTHAGVATVAAERNTPTEDVGRVSTFEVPDPVHCEVRDVGARIDAVATMLDRIHQGIWDALTARTREPYPGGVGLDQLTWSHPGFCSYVATLVASAKDGASRLFEWFFTEYRDTPDLDTVGEYLWGAANTISQSEATAWRLVCETREGRPRTRGDGGRG